MIRLKDVKMQPKLIGLMLLVSIIPVSLVAWYSANSAQESLLAQSYNQLQSMREIKRSQIDRFFGERQGDMGVLVETVSALEAEAFNKMMAVQGLKGETLKNLFKSVANSISVIKDDPYTAGAYTELNRAFLNSGIKSREWQALADKYDARMQDIMKDNGWYDLFLVHPKGHVFYSVTKEADYGTNMVSGKYRDSGLGKLVRPMPRLSLTTMAIRSCLPIPRWI